MKIEIDRKGRKLYKFNHSIHQGGYLYCHKSATQLTNKEGLRNSLNAIILKLGLIDTTIKIYDKIFFLFFFPRPSTAPQDIIDTIQRNIAPFAEWEKEYVWTGAYDLQERFVRSDLQKMGFDYDKG